MNEQTFRITNLTCSACAKLCTLLLKKLPGVSDVRIDEQTGKTSIYSSEPIDLYAASDLLSAKGYTLLPL